jgi:hypothetical protein
MKIESEGGDVYAATEPGPDGYDKTIVSFEAEPGKPPFIIDLQRPLTKAELEDVLVKVAEVTQNYCAACDERHQHQAEAEDGMRNAAEIAGLQ